MTGTEKSSLVVVDPYNDFLSVGGRAWLLNRATLNAHNTNANLGQLLDHARSIGVPVCYAPHARYRKGLFDHRKYLNPSLYLARFFRTFDAKGWGGRFKKGLEPRPGEFVAKEHLVSSGFVGTDLDDHLKHEGVDHIILCGCLSNTCIESTARSAIELGYRVTIIVDALAAMSEADHDAAVTSGFPMCAHHVTSAEDWISEKRQ
ncbi:cysteine hydrolase family protein [uncultured Erythrobacter sp.]|uniref:cysteine hydrolase family protein n=1 Tax=uncultured Erythrobacter sp. TaxID=263913 RepID=UPI002617DE90|nr:isochorismatase family cysteine hydrolase [uncultured Erythrobacter sp.]